MVKPTTIISFFIGHQIAPIANVRACVFISCFLLCSFYSTLCFEFNCLAMDSTIIYSFSLKIVFLFPLLLLLLLLLLSFDSSSIAPTLTSMKQQISIINEQIFQECNARLFVGGIRTRERESRKKRRRIFKFSLHTYLDARYENRNCSYAHVYTRNRNECFTYILYTHTFICVHIFPT